MFINMTMLLLPWGLHVEKQKCHIQVPIGNKGAEHTTWRKPSCRRWLWISRARQGAPISRNTQHHSLLPDTNAAPADHSHPHQPRTLDARDLERSAPDSLETFELRAWTGKQYLIKCHLQSNIYLKLENSQASWTHARGSPDGKSTNRKDFCEY